MELQPHKSNDESAESPQGLRVDRIKLEAQVAVIKNQLGSLELVRARLGLSQRKMTQLLLVDPSCWSRWIKKPESVPPSVWRSLQWYMALVDKIPGLTPQYFIGGQSGLPENKELQLKIENEKRLRESWSFHIGQQLEVLNEQIIDQNKELSSQQAKMNDQVLLLKKSIFRWKMIAALGVASPFLLLILK